MRILFVTQYGPRAASSRTRVFNFLPFLRDNGVHCDVITVMPDSLLEGSQLIASRNPIRKARYYLRVARRTLSCGREAVRRAADYDLLFIQKVIFPGRIRQQLDNLSVPIVYDFDDAIFTTEIRTGHWLARWKEARNATGLPAMLSLADQAVVENDYTGQVAQRYCEVETITGPIDTEPYRSCTASPDGQQVRIVWIGSTSTVGYLDRLAETLRSLQQSLPQLQVLVIGADWSAPGVRVECQPWDLAAEAPALMSSDIGIMPIPDDPWTRGKGGYKLLQYMAAGLPVVTDPVGVNSEIVTDGVTGLLPDDLAAWQAALKRLATDADLRRRLGAAGRQRVEQKYSLAAQQTRWLDMLHRVRAA